MSAGSTARFARSAVRLCLAAGAVVVSIAWLVGEGGLAWAVAGWGSAAAIGVAGGSWLVARHGDSSWSFVVALLAGMLARLLAFGTGAALAAGAGAPQLWAFVGGFAVSFVALQVWEGVFLHRATRGSGGGGAHGGDERQRVGSGVTG